MASPHFLCVNMVLKDLEIVTIENYEKRIPIAKENFRRAGREAQITLLEGDAGQILKELEDSFDMIFMDAAKGQYINWLPDVMRLMKNGGVLISDNVLQEGDIIESHYLVERRNRTIYKRMREYLYELKHNPIPDNFDHSPGRRSYSQCENRSEQYENK